MSKISLVFSTLYPADLDIQKSCDNTLRLIEEWSEGYKDKCDLRIIAGSAHKNSVQRMNASIKEKDEALWDNSSILHCPFVLEDNMTERRGHEISFSKQYIFKELLNHNFDYLYFVDSDVYINFNDAWKNIRKLQNKPNSFIQFPYTLRKSVSISPDQFGVYVLPRPLITPEHASVIYETDFTMLGKLRRKGAPDCKLLKKLLKNGYHRIKADDIKSIHYDKDMKYIYNRGKCSREKRGN